MAAIAPTDPAARDRSVRAVRLVAWVSGLGAAGLTAVLSGVAAHAFGGHQEKAGAASPVRAPRPVVRLTVPSPQDVPAIAGAPASLQPPAQPPAAAPPSEQIPPQTSGGS
jgi:hypothetical protein